MQRKLILLTGPAGAGKNTVADEYARLVERCAIIDVDTVRQMLVKPHKAPWEGEEGKRQQEHGALNACALAKNFLQEDCAVIILDVITNTTADLYRKHLSSSGLYIVLLIPSLEETLKRNANRPPKISEGEIKELYRWQTELRVYDKKIDNTQLSVAETVKALRDERG